MRNPFSSASLENFKKSSSEAVRRFPLATLAAVFATCLAFMTVHEAFGSEDAPFVMRLVASCAVAYFASVAMGALSEGIGLAKTKSYALQAVGLAVAAAFFLVFDTESGYRGALTFALTFSVLIGFVFFAPYAKSPFAKKPGQDAYYGYFRRIAAVFVASAILWFALAVLGNVAIFAVNTLFDLPGSISGKLNADWSVIALILTTPFYALTAVPSRATFDSSKYSETAFFSFLAKFVAIPFVTVYFLILYAYSAKVLANFSEWPKGEVTWMVIGFSFFGYLAYAFSYGLEKDFVFVKKFRKALPFAVMPQIAMLAYAIWLRIAQYDLTANRYFVVVFGIMLLSLSAYFAFSKGKRIVAIPVAVVAISVLVSVGPWSVFSLPAARQEARLVRNLEAAGMMSQGTVSAPKTALTKELSVEIYEGADYLMDFGGTESVKKIFPAQYAKADAEARAEFDKGYSTGDSRGRSFLSRTREYRGPDRYRVMGLLKGDYGIKNKYEWDGYGGSYVLDYRAERTSSVDVRGYSELREFDVNSYDREEKRVGYDLETKKLTVFGSGSAKDEIDLSPFVSELVKKHPASTDKTVDATDLVYDSWKYRFVFKAFPVRNPEDTESGTRTSYWSMNGYVLVK